MHGHRSLVLQPVAGQPIVRIAEAETERGFAVLPSQLSEGLANFRRRELPPAVLAEQIARHVPVQPFRVRAAVLELAVSASEAAPVDFEPRMRRAVAVFGGDG